LYPRVDSYDVLDNKQIDEAGAQRLSLAAAQCWAALMAKDAMLVGKAMTESFEAQIAMFPNMVTPGVMEQIDQYKEQALGWKLSGAGGGGYLILFSETPVENAIQIRIRR
jgi:galactokinase/mevalonate kinase-like predicted kinase